MPLHRSESVPEACHQGSPTQRIPRSPGEAPSISPSVGGLPDVLSMCADEGHERQERAGRGEPPPLKPRPLKRSSIRSVDSVGASSSASSSTGSSSSSVASSSALSSRQRVVRELYATEQSYLNSLKTLVKVYVSPLRLDARGISPMASLNEVNALFSDVEAVLRISEKVFSDMTAHLERGTLDDNVGKVFCDLAPLLKLYTAYVNSHHRALATHQMLLGRPTYKAFCKMCEGLSECASCSLDSFLILPVQRVPRYELLLKELLKQTPAEHPEHADLEAALSKISSVAAMINDNLRDHERRNAVLAVQAKFGNSVQLVAPQRWLVREARLRKVCKRKTKPFLFVLFNDVLIYGAQAAMPVSAKRREVYRYHRAIDLRIADACACEDTSAGEPQFQVLSPVKSFKVIASNVQERDLWVKDLQSSIVEAQRANRSRSGAGMADASVRSIVMPSLLSTSSSSSFSSALGRRGSSSSDGLTAKASRLSLLLQPTHLEHAPVRSFGADVDACSLCAAEFSYLKRRYQCRRCGIIVCDKCSPHRWRLRNLNPNKLKRVCHRCFSQLIEGVPTWAPAAPSATDDLGLHRRGSMPAMALGHSASHTEAGSCSGTTKVVAGSFRDYGSLRAAQALDAVETGSRQFSARLSREIPFTGGSTEDTQSSDGSFSSCGTHSVGSLDGSAAHPLPEKWRAACDTDGEVYFWNVDTQEVTWDRPRAVMVPPPLPRRAGAVARHAPESAMPAFRSTASNSVSPERTGEPASSIVTKQATAAPPVRPCPMVPPRLAKSKIPTVPADSQASSTSASAETSRAPKLPPRIPGRQSSSSDSPEPAETRGGNGGSESKKSTGLAVPPPLAPRPRQLRRPTSSEPL